jgi:hypothetical protein
MNAQLAGRPKEEGGHVPVNISMAKELREKLRKTRELYGSESKFIEKAIEPLLNELDPGDACEDVLKVANRLTEMTKDALDELDFEKAQALSFVGESLAPHT